MKRIIAVLLVLLLCLMPVLGLCSSYLKTVSIYEVENHGEEFRVYAGFFDEENKSMEYIDEIKADINGMPIEVEFSDVISETEEGTAILFLVDVSGSVKGKAFDAIETSMNEWIDSMGFYDEYAIVSFGEEIEEVCYFTYDDDELLEAVDSLRPNEKYTRLNKALDNGVDIYKNAPDDIPNRRVMVMLSDGKNETKNEQDPSDESILATLDAAGIPVYALGCNYTNKKENEEYLKHMRDIANVSNGRYYDIEDLSSIDDVYYDLRDDVNNTYVIDLAFSEETSDFVESDEYILTIKGVKGSDEISNSVEIDLDDQVVQKLLVMSKPMQEQVQGQIQEQTQAPKQEQTQEQAQQQEQEIPRPSEEETEQSNILVDYWWVFIGLLVLILILLLLLLLLRNKKSKEIPYNAKAVVHNEQQNNTNVSTQSVAKPIDPSFVDNLRSDSIQKTVSYSDVKAVLFTIQMPKHDKFDAEVMVTDIVTLGSDSSCDIAIADDIINDVALNIIYRDGYMYISKVSDDVVAYINGMELALEVPLKNGDLINVGSALIKVNY